MSRVKKFGRGSEIYVFHLKPFAGGGGGIFVSFECQNGAIFRLVYSPARDQILRLKHKPN